MITLPVPELLQTKRVLCTVGSGGVGKTTCAAALGLLASMLGKKALVLTIDPAKRLASAMGLGALGAEERVLTVGELKAAGIPALQPISVRMLDLKASWDDMVRRLSPSPETTRAILGNRFYAHLSTELAGAQEYVACEHLYTMSYERDFDVVILDTPPTANALDFLEAPDRVLSILNHDAVKWAARPALAAGRFSLKLLDLAGGAAFKALENITGVEVLRELSEFLILFESLFDPIRSRTSAVQSLLTSSSTSFVLVASPELGPLNQARFFLQRLGELNLKVGTVVINRMRQSPPGAVDVESLVAALRESGVADDAARALMTPVTTAVADAQLQVRREEAVVLPLKKAAGTAPLLELPRLGDDVHDLKGLWQLADLLAAGLPVQTEP